MAEYPVLDPAATAVLLAEFEVGTKVIVRNHYVGTWAGGFMVAGRVESGYLLRRISDRHVLPDVFPFDDVRLERRRDPFRGIRGSYLDRR